MFSYNLRHDLTYRFDQFKQIFEGVINDLKVTCGIKPVNSKTDDWSP